MAALFLFPVPSCLLFSFLPVSPPWPFALGGQHKLSLFFCPLFLTVCALLVFVFFFFAKRRNEQAALPQGIVPFVFAKEYNVHPDILSTA